MTEPNENTPATVPEQPESKPPLRKSMPVVIALVVIIGLIGVANLSSLLSSNKKSAPASAISMRPAAPNAQQVNSFESQQELQAKRDADERQHQQELAAAMQQLEATQGVPGPEAAGAPPMTAAQRAAIYGDSPNAPQRTSNMSEAQAEAKQKELAKEKQGRTPSIATRLRSTLSVQHQFQQRRRPRKRRLLPQPAARLRPNQSTQQRRSIVKRTRWPDMTSIPMMAACIASSRERYSKVL